MTVHTEDVSAIEEGGSDDQDRERPDFLLAIAAGEPVWVEPGSPIRPFTRLVGILTLTCLAATLSLNWVAYVLNENAVGGAALAAVWVATVALALLAVRSLRLVLCIRRTARLWPSIIVRAALVTAAVAGVVVNSPAYGVLSIWPIAVALGAEAALTAQELGVPVRPLRWWWAFLRSPLHLGVIGATLASLATLGDVPTSGILVLYSQVPLNALLGAVVAGGLDRIHRDQELLTLDETRRATALDHRLNAHWLHDDVSAGLKLTELRLRNGGLSASEVADELVELDHQLRLRQLDELFRSGTVRLAEILQPFVRNAQHLGVEIARVPTFDEASGFVDEPCGRLFARAVAVVTNNAIVAGATTLSFEVAGDDEAVLLAVTDDAGGFELSGVPAGRGLWQLGQELGTGKIEVSAVADGSRVSVAIRRHEGVPDGKNSAG